MPDQNCKEEMDTDKQLTIDSKSKESMSKADVIRTALSNSFTVSKPTQSVQLTKVNDLREVVLRNSSALVDELEQAPTSRRNRHLQSRSVDIMQQGSGSKVLRGRILERSTSAIEVASQSFAQHQCICPETEVPWFIISNSNYMAIWWEWVTMSFVVYLSGGNIWQSSTRSQPT